MKKIGIYAGIVLLFLVLAYGFVPEVLTGKVVNQSDITGYRSMSQEAVAWNKAHPDDPTHWTDSMFGGMPTTSFMPSSDGVAVQSPFEREKAGELAVHFLAGSLSADAFAWCGQGSGHRRSGGGHVLLVQFPDHSGRAQHQDAGDRVPALGACGCDFHIPLGA